MSNDNLFDARKGMEQFIAAQRSGAKVYEEPLYSRIDLPGIVNNATTGLLNPTELRFFATPVGQVGSGYLRPLNFSDVSLEGAGNQLPGGVEFIADRCGLYLEPSMPLFLQQVFAEMSWLSQNRLSHIWKMGKSGFWPCAEYGVQSLSTTTNNTSYAVNGRTSMVSLPKGGEIYFPAKQIIDFVCNLTQAVNITNNGLAAGGGGGTLIERDGAGLNAAINTGGVAGTGFSARIGFVMRGWKFEVASVG